MNLCSRILLSAILMLGLCSAAYAESYNYISPEQTKKNLEAKAPMHLVDIQVKEAFEAHHLPGALQTEAYPVKSEQEKAKPDKALAIVQQDTAPVVIICPRGKGGAKRAYDYLKAKGVAETRLLILEMGQDGWPYPELVVKK